MASLATFAITVVPKFDDEANAMVSAAMTSLKVHVDGPKTLGHECHLRNIWLSMMVSTFHKD